LGKTASRKFFANKGGAPRLGKLQPDDVSGKNGFGYDCSRQDQLFMPML